MSEPQVGSGEEHATKVSDGMRRANAQRDRYLSALHNGETQLRFVVMESKRQDGKGLANIKLVDILSGMPGWTKTSAIEALIHNGFSSKSNLKDIRNSGLKMEIFEALTKGTAERWKPRPKMPDGWPFYGKLSAIMADPSITAPAELRDISDSSVHGRREIASDGTEDTGSIDNMIDDLLGMEDDQGEDEPGYNPFIVND